MPSSPISDLQPTLTGETVILRPLRAEDWDAMFAAASDPLIWAGHPVSNRYTERVFRHFFDGGLASASAFAIVDKATDAIIGSSRYYKHQPEQRTITIGFTFLIRRHWGGPTNAEIKRLMLDHAFGFVDVVTFDVGETNGRSRRAMEKIGGIQREGIVEKTIRSVTYRDVVFEIRKPDDRREMGELSE